MARFRHAMPFGSEVLTDGRVRFRLWAPRAERVELCLDPGTSDTTCLRMNGEPDGWYTLITTQAKIGSRYLYCIDGGQRVPDPASRFQPNDVHGASEVIDPFGWSWTDSTWRGRPWHEAVIYEIHVGSFTARGDYDGVCSKLDHLVNLGITALELMPVSDFPGRHNWGYDGVAPFAPDSCYGRPESLKALVNAAHERGLLILIDVVYNHFGPEGNYLHLYAPQFFTSKYQTPWGAAINYDGPQSHWVREFFIHNALYWLEEYRFDGLRVDAVHAIRDESCPDILTELAERVHAAIPARRHVHLILENDRNAAHYLTRSESAQPRWFTAQWNDDLHHALHVVLTGESTGYYCDYSVDPLRHVARCLTEGFSYQGERSVYRRGTRRGEPSAHLPPQAFVCFLQNHDQVGNRAFGERIDVLSTPAQLQAALAMLLLTPSPPLLFMGQEWGSRQPFPFFCDFSREIGAQVVAGREQQFAGQREFEDPAVRARIPDPMSERTFSDAVLDWDTAHRAPHVERLALHRRLLSIRHRKLIPHLAGAPAGTASWLRLGAHAIWVRWPMPDGSVLALYANFADTTLAGVSVPPFAPLYTTHPDAFGTRPTGELPPWCVTWYLHGAELPA